jgi:hypothetical protein
MPPIDRHMVTSREKTGRDFKEVHEWLDMDSARKMERHDITKVFEYGKYIEEQFGEEARAEYVRHLHDDIRAKFEHLRHDIETSIAETLAYFGIR